MGVPHEPGDSGYHVQLIGYAPAVGDAAVVCLSEGCVPNPWRPVVVHGDARPLCTAISAAQRSTTSKFGGGHASLLHYTVRDAELQLLLAEPHSTDGSLHAAEKSTDRDGPEGAPVYFRAAQCIITTFPSHKRCAIEATKRVKLAYCLCILHMRMALS